MINPQKLLRTWKQLKNVIKKRIKKYQPLTFQTVQENLKKLQIQAEQVGKEIIIWDKSEPKSETGLNDKNVEGVVDLFKEEE